ncbi:hypothetical protein L1887_06132 [Cichorium endivia]|nr:hypothetical protein L1887_06132 [Cichorium endivia]
MELNVTIRLLHFTGKFLVGTKGSPLHSLITADHHTSIRKQSAVGDPSPPAGNRGLHVQRPLLSFGPKASLELKTCPTNVCKKRRSSSQVIYFSSTVLTMKVQ